VETALLCSGSLCIVQDGGIYKLGEGDLEVACMKERMGEDVEKSHADSNVDNIMNAVTWRGGCNVYWKSALLLVYKWSFFSMFLLVIQENYEDIHDSWEESG
jgi:hypothetical protein